MKAKVTKSLRPGQRGTKKLMERYGDALCRVRFRVDEEAGIRYKTVELIEESWELQSPQPEQPSPEVCCGEVSQRAARPGVERMFWFRFRGYLPELFQAVMDAGGCRGKDKGVWGVPWERAEALGLLESRDVTQVSGS